MVRHLDVIARLSFKNQLFKRREFFRFTLGPQLLICQNV